MGWQGQSHLFISQKRSSRQSAQSQPRWQEKGLCPTQACSSIPVPTRVGSIFTTQPAASGGAWDHTEAKVPGPNPCSQERWVD